MFDSLSQVPGFPYYLRIAGGKINAYGEGPYWESHPVVFGGAASKSSLDDIVEELLPRHPVLGHIIPPPERVQKVRCLEWSDTNCK